MQVVGPLLLLLVLVLVLLLDQVLKPGTLNVFS
jgi:hypothetical protein